MRVTEMISSLPAQLTVGDVLDVVLVAALIYFLLSALGAVRARAFLLVLGVVGGLHLVTTAFGLHLSSMLIGAGFWLVTLVAVIAFQDDIRRNLHRMTAWRLLGGHNGGSKSSARKELAESVVRMAASRVGALIVIPGQETLNPHIAGGLPLQGKLSGALLESIFSPDSPGHDGAVIVQNGFIPRFGVYLPLSRTMETNGQLGTRHTAALGLTERCDALVIVVSEERGEISIAHNGVLERNLDQEQVEERLEKHGGVDEQKKRRARLMQRMMGRAAISLGAAAVLWFTFVFREGTVQQTLEVPVELRNIPEDLALVEPKPLRTRITVRGRRAAFADLNDHEISASLDLAEAQAGFHRLAIDRSDVEAPIALEVLQIEPPMISLRLTETSIARRPIQVVTTGPVPQGTRFEVTPPSVKVRLPAGQLDTPAIVTEPVDVAQLEGVKTMKLILPPGARLVDGEASSVEIRLVKPG